MQTGDQTKMASGGIGNMRISACLATSILGATLALANPLVAATQDGQAWQTCVSASTAADDRVSACSAVIDAKAETGRKLAPAYCNRGHDLTQNRQPDPPLA